MEADPNYFKKKIYIKKMPVIWTPLIQNSGQFTKARLTWHLKERLAVLGEAMWINTVHSIRWVKETLDKHR